MRLYETQEPIVTKLQNNQCNRFVERQLFEVFLNLGSTNQMKMVLISISKLKIARLIS